MNYIDHEVEKEAKTQVIHGIRTRMRYEVRVPAIFASDHYDRELPSGELLEQGKAYYRFYCTIADLKEWLDDAEFYSDRSHWSDVCKDDPSLLSICRSAERARKVLRETIKRIQYNEAT